MRTSAPASSRCCRGAHRSLQRSALEQALSSRQVAAFIVEPIQGKGVNLPTDEFLPGAAALCKKYGTIFIADEIQTGIGRTGKFLAVEHWNVEPDMVLLAKVAGRSRPGRRAAHTQEHLRQDLQPDGPRGRARLDLCEERSGDAAGIATLDVIKNEKLVEQAAKRGAELRLALTRMVPGYELLKEVRGKGLMIGIEFGPPKSLKLKASGIRWRPPTRACSASSSPCRCSRITRS